MNRRLGLALVLCAVAPNLAVAKGDPFKPSVKDQIRLGGQVAEEIRKKAKLLPETDDRVALVRKIGERLVSMIPPEELKKNPWTFTFDIVDDKEINAFALPGGPVFFMRGLLEKFSTEDQIAGVLAHEMTHVRNQHWASAYADNQKRQLGLTALLLIFHANKNLFDLASISDELVFQLPYSRKHESEADTVGFEMVRSAGFNPQGMIDVFKILLNAPGGRSTEEWSSDHPATANRIKKVQEMIVKSGLQFPVQKALPPIWFLRNIRPIR